MVSGKSKVDIRFIVDINAGKLAKWLRIIGYDTLLFNELDDGQMVKIATQDNRVILTRDTQLLKRRVITSGKVKALLVEGEDPKDQLRQIVADLDLDYKHQPFSRCIECNTRLIEKQKNTLKERIPPYVYKTQDYFMECPDCNRIYWQGTHWTAMNSELDEIAATINKNTGDSR